LEVSLQRFYCASGSISDFPFFVCLVISLPHLEHKVKKRKEEAEQDRMLMKAQSREELQQATLTKMKNVTGAKEDVCVAMLESNGYDLKTSVETFFLER